MSVDVGDPSPEEMSVSTFDETKNPETAETSLREAEPGRVSEAEIKAALSEVDGTLEEVRPEVSERIREADAADWMGELRELLKPHTSDFETARVATTALACVETVLAIMDGRQDLDLATAAKLLAFALQVYEYIDKEHYLGDLDRAAEKLEPLLEQLKSARTEASSDET